MTKKSKSQMHPFMPAPMHKPRIILWLKHFHAWFGVCGAFAGLIFMWSGFVLNHRTDFRLGADVVTIESTIPAPESKDFADGDEFGRYVKLKLGLNSQPRAPVRGERGAAVPGEGYVGTPKRFAASFVAASEAVTARYDIGADAIAIGRQHRPLQRTLNRMHLGQAPNAGWQVIMDVFSGALIFLCLSGFLIWTRLDGGRLLGGALVGMSFGLVAYWMLASV